jgi:hypothetical protein
VKLRLPFDAPLPEGTLGKVGVLAMLAIGGAVALVVAVVFAVTLFEMLRAG